MNGTVGSALLRVQRVCVSPSNSTSLQVDSSRLLSQVRGLHSTRYWKLTQFEWTEYVETTDTHLCVRLSWLCIENKTSERYIWGKQRNGGVTFFRCTVCLVKEWKGFSVMAAGETEPLSVSTELWNCLYWVNSRYINVVWTWSGKHEFEFNSRDFMFHSAGASWNMKSLELNSNPCFPQQVQTTYNIM